MAHVLNFFNRPGNRLVASALDIRPGHRVLEVGFGGGAAIPTTLAALDGDGRLCGVDLSADMARLAAGRFGGGVVVFACGDAQALPIRSGIFDRAYAMHSHLYWPSVPAGLAEVHRVLQPGGRMLLGMDVISGVRLVRWFGRGYKPAGAEVLARQVTAAGFGEVATRKLTRGLVVVLGTRT